MKKARKIVVAVIALVLVAAIAVAGTLMYLRDDKEVKNTFTVGNVKIVLDEAIVDENGEGTDDRTEVGNTDVITGTDGEKYGYKLFPGVTYDKDPVTSVLVDSEECYVRMKVIVNKGKELSAIMFDEEGNVRYNPLEFFTGVDLNTWIPQFEKSDLQNVDGSLTLEFWYKEKVAAVTSGTEFTTDKGSYEGLRLPALFTGCTIPGSITNEQLATLDGMEIIVRAEAIQAASFDDAEAAFAALDAELNP